MTMNRNDELYLEMTSDEAIFAIEINNAEGNSKKSEKFSIIYALFSFFRHKTSSERLNSFFLHT